MPTDPTIVTLKPAPTPEEASRGIPDLYQLRENHQGNARDLEKGLPSRYADAVVTVPEVEAWVRAVVAESVAKSRSLVPYSHFGPSLLLLGPTGTGKTYQAWGAIRALCASGVRTLFQVVTAADLYARMRPRHGVDSEDVFETYARTGVLVLDDLGAAKNSEFTEEINYRLVNYRYERQKPTLITSNVLPKNLAEALGERVTSRLVEMASRVTLKGEDRRRSLAPTLPAAS